MLDYTKCLVSHPRPPQDFDASSPCFIGKGRHVCKHYSAVVKIHSMTKDVSARRIEDDKPAG